MSDFQTFLESSLTTQQNSIEVYHFEFEQLNDASLILYKALLAEPQVYKDIAKVGKRLSWVLNFNVSKVGNDGKRIQKCVLFLRDLKEHAEKASA